MKYFQVTTLSMLLLCDSTLAMGKEVTGMIRKYSDFTIFWPCSSLLPHYVVVDPSAEPDMATYFFETQSLYITVDAEITNEQTRGQDGTIIIYRILDSEENIRGCQIPTD